MSSCTTVVRLCGGKLREIAASLQSFIYLENGVLDCCFLIWGCHRLHGFHNVTGAKFSSRKNTVVNFNDVVTKLRTDGSTDLADGCGIGSILKWIDITQTGGITQIAAINLAALIIRIFFGQFGKILAFQRSFVKG